MADLFDWQCPNCRCHAYGRIDRAVLGGGFGFEPGLGVRCVECKMAYWPAGATDAPAVEPKPPCAEDCVCVPGPHATTEPWTLTLCDDGYPMVNTPGDIVCNDDPNHSPGCKVSLERFRLIAAAPDLLAALNGMIDAYWRGSEDSDDEHAPSMVQAALAAIAKAKGGAS